jgi:hypothetical protein
MFKDLRIQYGLTRSELSQVTGRSVNYLLKAESLTFPTAPVALLDFYCSPEPKVKLPDWEQHDRDLLTSAYRDAQRAHREKWLDHWVPRPLSTVGFTFCRKWLSRWEEDWTTPTEYGVSQGLCIPAAAVYRSERDGTVSSVLRTALSDVADYCVSGRFAAKYGYSQDTNQIVDDVLRIQQELE